MFEFDNDYEARKHAFAKVCADSNYAKRIADLESRVTKLEELISNQDKYIANLECYIDANIKH